MPFIPSSRQTYFAIFLAALIAMVVALALQYYAHLEPCALCVFQRAAMVATCVVALLAFLHGPGRRGSRIYAGLTLLAASTGVAVAGRHVWLQHLPPEEVPACGPGLDYWMDTFPFYEVLMKVFRGSGECAVVDSALFGLSLPAWTLMAFLGLGVLAVWQLLRRH